MLRYLRSLGFSRVKGIDLSAEQIELAQASGTDAEGIDVFDFLRSVDEPYAAVIALDFLEHFTKDELMALIPLIHGALDEGGSLVIQTPNGEGLFPNQVVYGDLTHSTIFTPSSLSQLLSVMGFGELRFFETGPAPKNLTGLARSALWRALKALANGVRIIEANKRQDLWTENMICVCSRAADPRETGR
jgi:cyclopropane fatty-acyl-phospholipid synthase-like methyltransferase